MTPWEESYRIASILSTKSASACHGLVRKLFLQRIVPSRIQDPSLRQGKRCLFDVLALPQFNLATASLVTREAPSFQVNMAELTLLHRCADLGLLACNGLGAPLNATLGSVVTDSRPKKQGLAQNSLERKETVRVACETD